MPGEIALLRPRDRRLVPRMFRVDLVAERVPPNKDLLVIPVIVIGVAEQDAHLQIDVDQIRRHQLAVDDDARGHVHRAPPIGHRPVSVVADIRVLICAPAAEQNAPLADFFVAGQCLVEEIEQIVVQWHALFHELDISEQPGHVFGEELHRRHRADPAGIEGRGVDVAPLHQAEHLAGVAADEQRLAVELPGERVQRRHDVADRAVAVIGGVRRRRVLRLVPQAGIGLPHHLLAKIDADEIVLKNIVVEHVFGSFAKIDDPLGDVRRLYAVSHVLGVDRAGSMVVAADTANTAGNEVRVARVLALHKDAVAAEDRRSAVALGDPAIFKVDLGVNAETADDPRDRIPIHLDQIAGRPGCAGGGALC